MVEIREVECDGVCILKDNLYHEGCPLHSKTKEVLNRKSFLDNIRDLQGKRTSNGFRPLRGQKAQLRGD